MRLALTIACAVVLAVSVTTPAQAFAALPQRTEDEIRARWRQLRPDYGGSPYSVTPRLTAPYATGTLAPGFLSDGLDAINHVRFLAGLPDDIELDPTLVDAAQHGAVLLAVGEFAHSQPKPADMGQAFYEIANSATNSSNIGWGYTTLWDFNFGCADDSDPYNIDRLGHRRWLLNPSMQYTGMGYADARATTYAFDSRRPETVDYDTVNWPAAGAFPVQMTSSGMAWSVTLNPAKYRYDAGRAGHTVVMQRLGDGRTWTLDAADTDPNGEYFNFDTDGYGVANCFVFRPDPDTVGGYRVGDSFRVTISGGIYNTGGTPATISYTTTFVSQTLEPARVAGPDRYATAIAVSKRAHPEGAPAVVLATGADFPDALCASPLAGAYGGPVLLVPRSGLTSAIAAELERLGPERIFIVGSVPAAVDAQCAALSSGPQVTRLTGADRYATAELIAAALAEKTGSCPTVVLATGTDYPDALSSAPLATAKGWPILLVAQGSDLAPSLADLLDEFGTERTLVLGGTAAVPAAVAEQTPGPVRLAGSNRYETCGAMADFALSQGMSMRYTAVATGIDFPDALAAGPLVAERGGTLLLTHRDWLPIATSRRIGANSGAIESIDVIGGAGAVSDGTLGELKLQL